MKASQSVPSGQPGLHSARFSAMRAAAPPSRGFFSARFFQHARVFQCATFLLCAGSSARDFSTMRGLFFP